MSESSTLSALIDEARFKLHWFDLGRRLQSIPRSTAAAFEEGRAPWPHPYLRQAWAGLLLWPEEGGEPVVWFLRLPLDEQGKLQLPVRDALLRRITEKTEVSDASRAAAQLHGALEQSGLLYTPSPERQACFHARAALLLKREPSSHYAAALEYLRAPDKQRWDRLGIQGIADLAARWEEHRSLLLEHVGAIAPPVFIGLCQCLENETIDHQLAQKLIERAERELGGQTPDSAIVTAAIRGISHSPANGLRKDFLLHLLGTLAATPEAERATGVVEMLAAIGSRCADDLEDTRLAAPWLAALAQQQTQDTFNLLLSDLMFLPRVRAALLSALRNPQRSEALASAFGKFLHGSEPTH